MGKRKTLKETDGKKGGQSTGIKVTQTGTGMGSVGVGR